MKLLNSRKVTGVCHDCEYRHLICDYPSPYETKQPCTHWKLGGCFVCAYNKEEMTEQELHDWLSRGCEGMFPSRGHCKRFKRNWKKILQGLQNRLARRSNS